MKGNPYERAHIGQSFESRIQPLGQGRGLGYVCGHGEPYGGDEGCGLYFCSKHGGAYLCKRCREGKSPFKPKPEHPDWLWWKLLDPSWHEWRLLHLPEISVYFAQLEGSAPSKRLVKELKTSSPE